MRTPTAPKWVDADQVAYLKRDDVGRVQGLAVVGLEGWGSMVVDPIAPDDGFAQSPDGHWLAYVRGEKDTLVLLDLRVESDPSRGWGSLKA